MGEAAVFAVLFAAMVLGARVFFTAKACSRSSFGAGVRVPFFGAGLRVDRARDPVAMMMEGRAIMEATDHPVALTRTPEAGV